MEYANAIYSGGFQTSHIVTEMRLLVMYFRDVLGYTEAKCKAELKDFCDSHISGFDSTKNWSLISRAVSAFKDKSQLASVPSVSVWQSDIDLSMHIGETENEQRVIFT